MIRLVIPGRAVAKGRPRFSRHGKFVRTFTPEKTVTFESFVRILAAEAMRGQKPLDEPLAIRIDVTMQVPASWSARKRARALAGELLPTGRPDVENLSKSILDAGNSVIYRDDSLICDLSVRKRYGDIPQAVLEVEPIRPVFNLRSEEGPSAA